MRRLDLRGAVNFVDIVTGDGTCPVNRRAALERLHAREGDGPVLSGAAAFAAMWRAIPLLRPLGLLARNGVVLRTLNGHINASCGSGHHREPSSPPDQHKVKWQSRPRLQGQHSADTQGASASV